MTAHTLPDAQATGPTALRPAQLAWLATAVFVVSAVYAALMPLVPGWLAPMLPGATATEVARHVGFLSGVYAAGVLVGALLWGGVSDRVGHGRILIGAGLVLAMTGLAVLGQQCSKLWIYLEVKFASAGTGLMLPMIGYLAANASANRLGATMGGLAVAAGLGQMLGSATGGWVFGAFAQRSFAWLTVSLLATLLLLLVRPLWWSGITAKFSRGATRQLTARLTPDGRGGT